MAERSQLSLKLYDTMLKRGYPMEAAELITENLNTDFTAKRMLGYLGHYHHPSLEDLADEMLAILSDRERIVRKKILENNNAKWNMHMMRGFDEEE